MIKARAGDSIVFGLSHTNLDRLRQGQPIRIDGSEMGLPVDIMIFAGATEQTMAAELVQLIGPGTIVHIDPKLRS